VALVEAQSDEIWGLAWVLVGALVALGTYAQLAGPVGRGVRQGAADLFGLSRYVVPAGFLALGGYLLSHRARPQPARVAVGLGLALVSLSGLIADAGATPSVRQSLRAMRGAGGLAGMLVTVALRAGLGTWGAGLVLAAVLLVALLVTTATPVRAVGHGLRGAGRLGWRGARFALGTTWRLVRAESGAGADASIDWEDEATGWAGEALDDEEPWAPGKVPAPGAAGEFGWPALAGKEPEERDRRHEGDGRGGRQGRDGRQGANQGGKRSAKGRSVGEAEAEARAGSGPGVPLLAAEPLPIGGLASASKGEQLAIDLGPTPQVRPPWRLPSISLLKRSKAALVDRHQVEVLGQTLQGALAALGVETRLVGATVGPSVTRYELELGPGVKVQRVTALHRDIAYAMAATEVRILAPIPGRSAIGVEVPNRQRQTVTLGDVLSSGEAAAARHPLEVAAGRDIAGRPVLVNLAEMPHILIAGATGSGKSSCLNAMLTSVLMRATPDQVRLILVDPKRVELGAYAGLPHLLTNVVTNPKRAANALHWAVEEMERRYDLLAEVGMRDITGYNAAYDRGELNGQPGGYPEGEVRAAEGWAEREPAKWGPATWGPADREPAERARGERGPAEAEDEDWGEGHDTAAGAWEDRTVPEGAEGLQAQRYERLPFILVVVDELNDLMMVAARDVEESICRIAQMARAVGIHLVIATQRPSVDVITGLIKANIPSRLAFAVSSLADSRVVLDQAGAERLIGKGDMLLLTASSSSPRRLQGPWVDEEDVRKVVAHWRRQASPSYVEGIDGQEAGPGEAGGDPEDNDDLLEAAMELVVRSQLGSTSMLQRKLRVGFARAGRLMDLLEQRGVVGPSEGSKARAVLMTVDELESRGD
jgi:S-DNA-T family DNA segregation ATPase FtsK/SpoIIIE